ncbi:cobalamin biosynthesis protein [Actinoplanes solisilvae]|uniref:cobalamin biosynthesis protein n=1 Tax=Actinoplanes solisilvae TaxID=2486853 RepID=UPI0013E315D1|nr:cobalamin biosynthesis protein [Actinoplanes solisilvae]
MIAVGSQSGDRQGGDGVGVVIAVGFGSRDGVGGEEIAAAVDQVLAEAGISAGEVTVLATVDRRSGAEGLRKIADDRGWTLAGLTAAELAAREAPNASEFVAHRVGTPSVAESAALIAAGSSSTLLVPKRIFPRVTVAVARS